MAYITYPSLAVPLVFLLVWLLGSSSIEPTSAKCIDSERKALVNFKHGLNDPSRRLSSWKGDDCCRWSGVGCNNISGHVVRLDLRNPFPIPSIEAFNSMENDELMAYRSHYRRSCLGGKISSSLLHLRYLNYLDLSLNYFEGIRIPKFLSTLENLRYLNLSSSLFAREIPPHLGNLTSLNYLDLSVAKTLLPLVFGLPAFELRATNLEWLSGLSSLKYLAMGFVEVNDTNWLQSINMLPNLEELLLPACALPNLPPSLMFVNLTLLSVLDISGNEFSSLITNWLYNLTSLVELDLSSNYFTGTISCEFMNLKSLESLGISYNGFNSSIPNCLSSLTSLTKLDLSHNFISGAIPCEFVYLKSLESLALPNNKFEGQIPKFLGNLCNLKNLDLSRNKFNSEVVEFFGGFSGCPTNSLVSLNLEYNSCKGELPESIGVLENLQFMYLSKNSLSGSIPKSIQNLSVLQELDLSFNKMNGTIPESIGQLSKLTHLYLEENSWKGVVTEVQLMNLTRLRSLRITTDKVMSLVFNVTYKWLPPFRLESLRLANCLVGPRFSLWLQAQSELTSVSLTNVGIEDTIPDKWFFRISSQLTDLDLSNNQIKGKLPSHLEYPNLKWIELSNNRFEGSFPLWSTNASLLSLYNNSFSGPLPSNIDKLFPQLNYLYIFENRLNGTIPLSICKMKSLVVLSLGTNQLSGKLPQCWNKLQKLRFLDVANNNLSGNIPSSFGSLSFLDTLLLSRNNLNGKIPPSLQYCSRMQSIDLGENRLSGKLPLWIGQNTIPSLQLLRLRSNSFRGVIPQQWCNLTYLHILDLAHNSLSGVIPSCLGNLLALVYGNSSSFVYSWEQISLVAKGRELNYGYTLNYVNSIDLSANSLVGEILEEITRLIALGTLNFSMNHLSGSIPAKIGNLHLLETLDVSNNNLSGSIPQSLSSLTFLAHLNLSHNNLLGKIPTGNQLQTLDDLSIYEGNPLLCGLPLPTKCPSDDTSNVPPLNGGGFNDSENENDLDMTWFYVSMGPGFVVGFWAVFGSLLIKKSWRHAYFQFLENMTERIALVIALGVARLRRRWAH